MEFMFSVHDEKHNNEIIRDACADETGIGEILKRFTCAKANERAAFMLKLKEGKDAHIQGYRHYNNEARYTVRAFRYPTPEEQLLHAIFSGSEESGIAHAAQGLDNTYPE